MINNIQNRILQLKAEKDIAIFAHSYQAPEIQEIADITGDSFALSVKAREVPQKTIVMCGVRFMADTIKILSPEKTVILPVPEATCPMAEQISPKRVEDFKKENPNFKIIAYINTTTELKAVCDVCVTSSSALNIVKNIEDEDILFIPDYNLGSYIKQQCPEKNIMLWNGCCPTHASVTIKDCELSKEKHPNAKFLMHPELPPQILKYADFIGSTSAILDYARKYDGECVVGTEKSILDLLAIEFPERKFHLLSKRLICPNMRICNIADVLHAVEGCGGEHIEIEENLRLAAKHPIDEMIRLS